MEVWGDPDESCYSGHQGARSRMRREEIERGSGDNYFKKCCYQEKPRNREVGGRRHKIGDFLKWEI